MDRRDVEAGRRRRKSRGPLTSRPEIERLLDAARAPARTRELAGERAAVDLFARARLLSSTPLLGDETNVTGSARAGLKAAVAAAAAVVLVSTGVAFAASGHAPWSDLSGATASATHAAHPTHPTHPSDPASESSEPSDDSSERTGPNAHAFGGLCRAYASGSKAQHGHALQSPAFAALVAAAGGADNVATYCGTATSGPLGSHPSHPRLPRHPGHPAHPSQPAAPRHPTHPAHPAHPAHPTQAATPTHKPTDKSSHTPHPSS
jgi:hypothetical protein